MKKEQKIKYYFQDELDSNLKEKVLFLLQETRSASIEQNPDWLRLNNPSKKIIHFYALKGEELVSYSNIVENKLVAQIHLGPICSEKEILISSLKSIRDFYLKKGFAQLEVQLAIETSQESDDIEYTLYKSTSFTQKFDITNWSTIVIRLDKDIDEIFKSFKKNHKGSIKKALKEGLTVRPIDLNEDIRDFALLYDKMYKSRGLVKNFPDTLDLFRKLSKMFIEQKNGKILSVFNSKGKMIGGVVLGIQNSEMYYKYGASDPEYRKLPILHLALFEGIKLAKKENLSIFNFGGYNHFVKEGDQVYAINFFKRSFNGEFIFYPKRMYFELNKMKLLVFNIVRFTYRKVNLLRK